MKRLVATAVLALLAGTSIASAQDWMSWKAQPAQRSASEPVPAEPRTELSASLPAAAQVAPDPGPQTQSKGPARDNGIIGNPTPALALYVAQAEFAHKNCELESTKQNDRFYQWAVKRGLMLDEYRKKDETFSLAETVFLERFRNSWLQLDQDKQRKFCEGYAEDVSWAKDKSRLGILNISDRFRAHFSPLSQERIDKARKASIFAGVLSLGFTAAGINQVNQHDFATGGQFNNYGAAFANLINDPSAISKIPCESYLPFLLANIKPKAVAFDTYYSVKECSIPTRSSNHSFKPMPLRGAA